MAANLVVRSHDCRYLGKGHVVIVSTGEYGQTRWKWNPQLPTTPQRPSGHDSS